MYLYLNPLEIEIKKKNFLWFFSKQSLVTGVAWFCLGIWRVTKLRWLTIKSLKCFWIVSYGPLCLCPNPVTFLLPCFPLILWLIQYCTKKNLQSCVTRQRRCLQRLPISPLWFMSLEMTLIFPEGSRIQKHAKLHC